MDRVQEARDIKNLLVEWGANENDVKATALACALGIDAKITFHPPCASQAPSCCQWLEEAQSWIHKKEEEASACLQAGNTEAYVRCMRDKAVFLVSLAAASAEHLTGLPEPLRANVEQRLKKFSSSASCALDLDSVFYMSALLFPEDHKVGQPNDLDDLVAWVAQQMAQEKH